MSIATPNAVFPKHLNVTVGAAPKAMRHGSNILIGSLVAVSVGVGLIGMISSIGGPLTAPVSASLTGIAHIADRFKNNTVASDELKYRAEYYTAQIYRQLELQGIRPDKSRKATVEEFKKAAASNATLAGYYKAPIAKRNEANNESLMINGGIALAGALIPGGGIVAGVADTGKSALEIGHAAKIVAGTVKAAKSLLPTMAGGLAGGALAHAISGKIVDPQTLLEAMDETIAAAKEQGINPNQVIAPNMLFLLRVSQDPQLSETIKRTFGHGTKSFHEMGEDEQTQVMIAYPALANAATSEAYAITHDMIPVAELGASPPNLNGTANQYAVGTRNSSFVNSLGARNSSGGFAERHNARQAQALQTANTLR